MHAIGNGKFQCMLKKSALTLLFFFFFYQGLILFWSKIQTGHILIYFLQLNQTNVPLTNHHDIKFKASLHGFASHLVQDCLNADISE